MNFGRLCGNGIKRLKFFALASLVVFSNSSLANVGQTYGFGARAESLGGITSASDFQDGYSAYSNPALVASPLDHRRLHLSFGMIWMVPSFTPISGVVTENNYVTGQSPVKTGTVDTDYRSTIGQELGFTYALSPNAHHFSLGLTTFFPLDSMAYLDSGEVYQPEYFLERSRTQRPQIEIALAMEASKGFSIGIGGHVGFSITSNAKVFLQTSTTQPSSTRISASLKPRMSPYLGLMYQPNREFNLGLTVRAALKSANTLILTSSSRVLGNFGALDILLNGSGAAFYDPTSVEFGGGLSLSEITKVYLQMDYQFWKDFESPNITIDNATVPNCTGAGCSGLQISPSNNPSPEFRNIFVPHFGQEWKLSDETTLRYGYSYRTSILTHLPSGAGNGLDPSRHEFSLGIGIKVKEFLGFNLPAVLDFAFSYQSLVSETIEKSSGNEIGNTSDQKIGSPGYEAGGKILGGGLSLSLGF